MRPARAQQRPELGPPVSHHRDHDERQRSSQHHRRAERQEPEVGARAPDREADSDRQQRGLTRRDPPRHEEQRERGHDGQIGVPRQKQHDAFDPAPDDEQRDQRDHCEARRSCANEQPHEERGPRPVPPQRHGGCGRRSVSEDVIRDPLDRIDPRQRMVVAAHRRVRTRQREIPTGVTDDELGDGPIAHHRPTVRELHHARDEEHRADDGRKGERGSKWACRDRGTRRRAHGSTTTAKVSCPSGPR